MLFLAQDIEIENFILTQTNLLIILSLNIIGSIPVILYFTKKDVLLKHNFFWTLFLLPITAIIFDIVAAFASMAMMMTFVMIYDSILTSIIGGIFVLVISIGLKHFIYRDIIRYVNKTDYFGKYPVILSLTTLPIVIPFIFYTLYTL